jgi:hypothetical protein
MREGRATRSTSRGVHLALVAPIVLLLLLPSTATAGREHFPGVDTPASVAPSAIGPLVASVFWNGQNASGASSPSSAFTIGSGQTANVTFAYARTLFQSNASLTLTYLGLTLTTNTAPFHSAAGGGAATVNWSFGALIQLTEGVYQLTAKITNATGASLWSESFYIDVKTPYSLESGLVIFLIILVLAEAYWIGASIRGARRGGRRRGGAERDMRKAGGDPQVGSGVTPWSGPETPTTPSTPGGGGMPPTEPPAGGTP